jgi:hypothetical protein
MPIIFNFPCTEDVVFIKIAFQNVAGIGPFSNEYKIGDGPVVPVSNICFLGETLVKTDQGFQQIQHLNSTSSIDGVNVLCITCTTTDESFLICFKRGCLGPNMPSEDVITTQRHCLQFCGMLIEANYFIGCPGVLRVPYSGQKLYNIVLQEDNRLVEIANLFWDTLPKYSLVSKYFLDRQHADFQILTTAAA